MFYLGYRSMTSANYVDVPAYIILTIVGLAMSFWGKQLARVLSSISFAAFLSYITWFYTYTAWKSVALSVMLTLLAIAIGFAVGFLLFRLAISMLFAYIITTLVLPQRGLLFLLLVVIITMVMYVASNYIISLLFAITGATMVYKGLTTLGLKETITIIICIVVFALGFYNQLKSRV